MDCLKKNFLDKKYCGITEYITLNSHQRIIVCWFIIKIYQILSNTFANKTSYKI